jgi:hypothetical protein
MMIVIQLVKKFPGFYGTRRFITVFTGARSLSWVIWIQSTPSYCIYLISVLILSSYLLWGLLNCLHPAGFRTEILYGFLISPCVLHVRPISSSLTWPWHLAKLLILRFPFPNFIRTCITYRNTVKCSGLFMWRWTWRAVGTVLFYSAGEVKLSLRLTEYHAMETCGSGGIAPHILNLDIRWSWVVSFTSRPLYPGTRWIGG